MSRKVSIIVRLILYAIVIFIFVYLFNVYVLKTFRKAQKYIYNVVESNMQTGMSTYILTEYGSIESNSKVKLSIKELIQHNYLTENTVPMECSSNKSYITASINNKTINYKICLICSNYKSKDC